MLINRLAKDMPSIARGVRKERLMSNMAGRLARVEKVLGERKFKPDSMIWMAVPNDYPSPLPPNSCRMKDIDKIDSHGCRSVLVIWHDPRRQGKDCKE